MDITPLDVQYEDVQEAGAVAPEVVVTGNSPLAPGPPLLGRDSPDRVRKGDLKGCRIICARGEGREVAL